MEPKALRIGLRIWVVLVLAFLFIPILLIMLYSFNRSNIESWPIASFSLHWYSVASHDAQVRSAFLLSVRVALFATALAVLLGSAVAYALYKYSFFGRDAISFLLVLPLALPGIITGIALNSLFTFTGIQFGTLTIVIGHTTFCIVVVFNNVVARLRRTSASLAEASSDLGARGWQGPAPGAPSPVCSVSDRSTAGAAVPREAARSVRMSSTSRLRFDTTAAPMIVVINAMSPLVTWKPSTAPTTAPTPAAPMPLARIAFGVSVRTQPA